METNHIHWLGHDSFLIEDDSMIIYIDPFQLQGNPPKADVIFVTHSHYDHFSIEDIEKIKKEGTMIVSTKDVTSTISTGTVTVVSDQSYTVGNLHVKTIPAYNLNKKFHPKENHWVGYSITLSNGQTIYHSGDTDFIPEMKALKVDIALLPCGGTYTMTAQEAAEAANTFHPKVLIPMHWGKIIGSKSDAETVKKLFRGITEIRIPEEVSGKKD